MRNVINGLHIDSHTERELQVLDTRRLERRCARLVGDAVRNTHRSTGVEVTGVVMIGVVWTNLKPVLIARAELVQTGRAELGEEPTYKARANH